MRNLRTAVAAIVAAGVLAGPAGSAAIGSVPAPRGGGSSAAVVSANARVHHAIDELPDVDDDATLEVVRVGEPLQDLLERPHFLDNVHLLQDHLSNNDAGALAGADVSIRDLLAIDIRSGHEVILFTR